MRHAALALISVCLGACTTEFDHSLLDKAAQSGCSDGVTILPGDSPDACGKNGQACQQCVTPASACQAGACVVPNAVVSLSLGESHSSAIDRNGGLWLWGLNVSGAVTEASVTEADTPVPVNLTGPTWSAAAVGGAGPELQTCAVATPGALYCWGANGDGQAGLGDADPGATPTEVGTDSDWFAVGAGRAYSCGLRGAGALYCWGWSATTSRLGLETLPADTKTPQHVPGGDDWQKLSVGQTHSCGIKHDASVWCWGDDDFGELGHAGNLPAQVENGTSYRDVSSGGTHTCGIRTNGTLWCWGDDSSGQLGVSASSSVPVQVSQAADWVSIAAGGRHTCGAHASGVIECWGANDSGQLGSGGFDPSPVPLAVTGSDWAFVAAGTDDTCAAKRDGTLWCWGINNSGQLGIANATFQPAPSPQLVVLE